MEYVDALKDINSIEAIKTVLRKQSQRDMLLFVLGINTGLRISDLLSLKVNEVWEGEKGKEFLFINDDKSGEEEAFYLNSKVQEELKTYLESTPLKEDDYIFKSKKLNRPISRQQAYRIINNAAEKARVPGNYGTHTLRKTFGYHAYKKGIAISIIMKILHHYSSAETLKYIGMEKNERQLIRVDVNL